ncbi:polysaccharide pyruvyl transferase family protein [Paraliobacillus sp. JSM ZJ581]|uniref:polysaccharide pyruvyl transferase family protein n=1 Tax=Paraliobacillus sp. JSM ZJ581 TaxID=3342118 RepID=UPI0035A854A2
MNKLVITNGWSDLNAGDSAIIMSIIKRFELEYGNQFSVKILSELNEKNSFYINSIDKIKEVFPHIEIELLSSPFYKVYDGKKTSKLKEIVSLFRNLLCLIFLRFSKKGDYYSAISEADVVVSKGGHFLHDRRGLKSIVHLFKCLYPIIIAKKLGKNYYFMAQSIGPFFNNTILSKINRNFVKYYLNQSQGVSVREEVSFDAMKEMNINDELLHKTSDYGFLVNKIEYNQRLYKISGKYIVITLRQHKFKNSEGEYNYLNTIKALSNFIFENYGFKTLVVPHVKGPNDFENDDIITRKFQRMLTYDESKYFIFNYDYLHAKELVDLYSNSEILIGTRFHSVIFGLCSSIPSIAISYSGFKANIMKQFDMDKFMINIEEVNSDNLEKLKYQVSTLIENNVTYRKKIQERLNVVIDFIIDDPVFKSIKKVIDKR